MATDNSDARVLGSIEKLVHEEEALYARPDLDSTGVARLHEIKVALDQCWDLLRQRRALRDAGQDPNRAHVRPPSVVENYEQ